MILLPLSISKILFAWIRPYVNSYGSTIQDCTVPLDGILPNFSFLTIVELSNIVSDIFVESDACGIVNTPE